MSSAKWRSWRAEINAPKTALSLLLLAGVTALGIHSLYLAAMRIYQVDECMEVYVARMLRGVGDKSAAGHVTLFQILLSFCLRAGATSTDCLCAARLGMVLLFWVNWLLLACATGARLLSLRWWMALAGAATLAPLWDFGFEVRHDNLLLTGVLGMWCLIRFARPGIATSLVLGAATVLLQFIAFKSFAYTLPLSVAAVALPRAGNPLARWKPALAWLTGAAAAFCTMRLSLEACGLWQLYSNSVTFLSSASTHGHHFGAGLALSRLLQQTPLLLALAASGTIALAVGFSRRDRTVLSWQSSLPEFLLFAGTLTILLLNPAPYPYNLLHLAPYAFLFGFKHLSYIVQTRDLPMNLVPILVSVLLFTHLVPFGVATRRHQNFPNTRQELLTSLAEETTDPLKDRVFDATGLVSTRPIVDNRTFLHSLNFNSVFQGPGPQIRDLLALHPPAVIICSYRTDWLVARDRDFILERYVPLADDFWVLGRILSSGGGTVEVVHPGRYRISTLEQSHLAGTHTNRFDSLSDPTPYASPRIRIDGAECGGRTLELTAGQHRLNCAPDCRPALVWVGPKLEQLPRIEQRDRQQLFINWY